MSRYLALLRGINVGGKNPVRMSALKALFEAQGFVDVVTYIQSGNVVFTSAERRAGLVPRIEAEVSEAFGYPAVVVLRSRQQLRGVIAGAPPGFGSRPALQRYDVVFLREPLAAAEAADLVPVTPGVDRVSLGQGVLYLSRLIRRASESGASRIASLPISRQVTIRSWGTTGRLLELMGARPRPPPPSVPGAR